MEIRALDDRFAVAPQMQPDDLVGLAAEGFVAVICNRPDAEEPGQPPLDAMRRAAQEAGLAFHHIPVAGGLFPPAAIAAFAAIRSQYAIVLRPMTIARLRLRRGRRTTG